MKNLPLKLRIVILAAVAASFANAQDTAVKVTYQTKAIPIKRLLEELSKSSGVVLSASGNLSKDIVILAVRKVPLDVVMGRLAQALHAEWQSHNGRYMLTRTPKLLRDERAAEIDLDAAMIADPLRKMADAAAKLGDLDLGVASERLAKAKNFEKLTNREQARQIDVLDSLQPSGRLMMRIVGSFDPRELAAIPPESVAVYSTAPNRMQRSMPPACLAALKLFMAEQEAFLAADAARSKKPAPLFPPEHESTKTLLTITRTDGFGGYRLVLRIADPQGYDVARASTRIPELVDAPQLLATQADDDTELKLSPESKALASATARSLGGVQTFRVEDPQLRTLLVRADKYDPLSFAISESILQIGQGRGESVLALVPDSAFEMDTWSRPPAKQTRGSFLQDLTRQDVRMTESDGWLTVLPRRQSICRRDRADRVALALLMAAVDKKNAVALDDAAQYALSTSTLESLLASRISMLLTGDGMSELFNLRDLRLYAAATPTQRKAFLDGDSITLAELTPVQRQIAEEMVFGPMPGLAPSWGTPEEQRYYWYGLGMEPTECFPNGLPADGLFRMTVSESDVMILGNQPGHSRANHFALTPDRLAWEILKQEQPELQNTDYFGPPLVLATDQMRLGLSRHIGFKFQLLPHVLMMRGTSYKEYVGSETYTLETLPLRMKKDVAGVMESLRRSLQDLGAPAGSKPPPTYNGRGRKLASGW